MSNVAGMAHGFTAFTPMKRWKSPFVRMFFWCVPIFSLGIGQRLFAWIHLVTAQKLLLALSFIHAVQSPLIAQAVLKKRHLRRAAGEAGKLRVDGPFPSTITVEFND